MIKDVAKWLKTAPPKKQIVEIQNGKDKVKIIPQKIIETLLDELTEQNWSTRNFQFSRWEQKAIKASSQNGYDGLVPIATMCDASLELVVTYRAMVLGSITNKDEPVMMDKEITRVLVGAVSFDVSFFGNDHIANTAKSLCITNAASDLGRRFGKDLNPNIPPVVSALAPGANKIVDTLAKITK